MKDENRIDAVEDPVPETEQGVRHECDVARDRDDPQWDHRLHEERREDQAGGKPCCKDDHRASSLRSRCRDCIVRTFAPKALPRAADVTSGSYRLAMPAALASRP